MSRPMLMTLTDGTTVCVQAAGGGWYQAILDGNAIASARSLDELRRRSDAAIAAMKKLAQPVVVYPV